MENRKCFLIAPIGSEKSEIRKNSDDLLDLIIIPALEQFGFEVIRADMIPRPSIITSDIIQLVQNADLCIIDLTGSNANVFYECGRRHETGKPFLQLIKKDEELPFDVSGIRTIRYDISSARSAHEAISTIQNYVRELEKSGFSQRTSGESLSSIANSVERIERTVSQLLQDKAKISEDIDQLELIRIKANPQKAFNNALASNDYNRARKILPHLKDKYGNSEEVLKPACIFAGAGDEYALEILKTIIKKPKHKLEFDSLFSVVRTIRDYYELIEKYDEGANYLSNLIENLQKRNDLSNKQRASLLNQLALIYYSSGEIEKTLPIEQKTIELDPQDDAYYYNIAYTYEMLGKYQEAIFSIEKSIELASEDIDYLKKALFLYLREKNKAKIKKIYNKILKQDRNTAQSLLKDTPELSQYIQSQDAEQKKATD